MLANIFESLKTDSYIFANMILHLLLLSNHSISGKSGAIQSWLCSFVTFTLVDALEQEQLYLMPMPAPLRWLYRSLGTRIQSYLVTL
ncbi:MAG: hypothetical protein FCKEOINB_02955 [Nitrosomonas sp.]|nr:hypothetical protein [Nitrosomonas sp.]